MAEELEIKLTMTRDTLALARAWLMRQIGAKEAGVRPLRNRYYDTPDADLNRRKIALRVRQAGDHFIQTLKTRGDYVDGAHRREEWEWPLLGTELNIGLIADTPVGQDINLARLQPVFETNFQRQVILLEADDAVIECALDEGEVAAGDQRRALCELEFELKGGRSEALLALTRSLAVDVPVFINLISKAEQGYDLAGLGVDPEAASPGAQEALVTRVLHGLSRAWLAGRVDSGLMDALAETEEQLGNEVSTRAGLQWLRQSLESGVGIPDLMRDRRLGQCQLALLECR